MNTIAFYSQTRDNNFNLIRFIAASLVIFSHSYPLSLGKGFPEPPSLLIDMSFGHIAVNIFFAVSGFLVAKSFCDRNNLVIFLLARFLRIFPALIMAILFCVFVIGVLFTSLSITDYFFNSETYKFILKNSTLVFTNIQYTLPGVFSDNIYPKAINGPLWTLPYELRMYFLLAIIGFLGLLTNKYIFNIFVLSYIVLFIYAHYFIDVELALSFYHAWRLSAYFLAGTFLYINRHLIPVNIYIALGFIVLSVIFWKTRLFPLLFFLMLIYVVFWFAFVPKGYIRQFNRIGDYSYGLYIYGFPIQQSIVVLYSGIDPIRLFVTSFLVTLLLAYLSWHKIEKPALRLKNHFNTIMLWGDNHLNRLKFSNNKFSE